MIQHIENESLTTPDALVVTMHCGEQCIVFDDGSTAPEGFDFYLERYGDRSNCEPCKGAFGGMVLELTSAVQVPA